MAPVNLTQIQTEQHASPHDPSLRPEPCAGSEALFRPPGGGSPQTYREHIVNMNVNISYRETYRETFLVPCARLSPD
jgi:hypothetical protein